MMLVWIFLIVAAAVSFVYQAYNALSEKVRYLHGRLGIDSNIV